MPFWAVAVPVLDSSLGGLDHLVWSVAVSVTDCINTVYHCRRFDLAWAWQKTNVCHVHDDVALRL